MGGMSFIGYGAAAMMTGSRIDEATLRSWGGEVRDRQPDPSKCSVWAVHGHADAVIQEAIMTPWWSEVLDTRHFIRLSAEPDAVSIVDERLQLSER